MTGSQEPVDEIGLFAGLEGGTRAQHLVGSAHGAQRRRPDNEVRTRAPDQSRW